jgi:hypothetical protein
MGSIMIILRWASPGKDLTRLRLLARLLTLVEVPKRFMLALISDRLLQHPLFAAANNSPRRQRLRSGKESTRGASPQLRLQ